MRIVVRYAVAHLFISFSVISSAQHWFPDHSAAEQLHIRKIDSIDAHKSALEDFKKTFANDSAIAEFDTTKKYRLRFSDTINYDRSDRRHFFETNAMGNAQYRVDSISDLYYRSRTHQHDTTRFTAGQIVAMFEIETKWYVPREEDSLNFENKSATKSKSYYDYFRPSMYGDKTLVLSRVHQYFGYNSIGLVNFSNQINHYFEVLE